jgi:hypothetical protein
MNPWETPTFQEVAMNAEIGAYQPEHGDDDRGDEPFAQREPKAARSAPARRG